MKRYFLSAMMVLLLAMTSAAYAEAQAILGSRYMIGDGVARDKVKAVEWLNKAAAQGHEDAQEALRKMIK